MKKQTFTYDEYNALINNFFVEGAVYINVYIPCDIYGKVGHALMTYGLPTDSYTTKEHFTSICIRINNRVSAYREQRIMLCCKNGVEVNILHYNEDISMTAFQMVRSALESGKYIKKCTYLTGGYGGEWHSTEYNGLQ